MPSVCHAPEVSLYFEVSGAVLACCHNRFHPLGTIPGQSLQEIWASEAVADLRSWLADGDLSHGCHACAFEIDAENRAGSTAATFDQFEPGDWPVRMEFALSNRCNLACVMCNGTNSSRIRAERELLPPLASAYGEPFFAQLAPFLPHLQQARFYGGEPFLVPEYQRIWDLMIAGGSTTECNVTTNGTVKTSRVEAVLDALPFSIGVSLDGITRETVESIRLGASFDTVMANIVWFRDYCDRTGTWFGLTYCLMTGNWHEFADFLLYAEDIGAGVAVNRVVQPTRFSLFHLSVEDLTVVRDGLQRDTDRLEGRLPTHQGVWDAQVAVLERQLDLVGKTVAGPPGAREADLLRDVLADAPFDGQAELLATLHRTAAGQHPSALRADTRDIVVDTTDGDFLGYPADQLVGRPASQVLATIAAANGREVAVVADRTERGATARVIRMGAGHDAAHLLAVTIAAGDADHPIAQIHAAIPLPAVGLLHLRGRHPRPGAGTER